MSGVHYVPLIIKKTAAKLIISKIDKTQKQNEYKRGQSVKCADLHKLGNNSL